MNLSFESSESFIERMDEATRNLEAQYAKAHPIRAKWRRIHRLFCLHKHKPARW